jgi:DNA polymerase-3 subunit epsilon
MPLLARPITDVPLAIVDVETTGLWAETGDRVCEVAVLRVEPGREPEVFSSLVNPHRPIEPAASNVSGLRDADVAGAPDFESLVGPLTARLEGAVLVAHNAEFDVGFLTAEYAIARAQPPSVPVIDTLALARQLFQFPRNNLGALAEEFGVRADRRHRAEGDAWTLYEVFLRMLEDLAKRGDWTVGDLIGAQSQHVCLKAPNSLHLTEPIRAAVGSGCPVTICYTDGDGLTTERIVRPLWANDSFLIAYCHTVKEQRTFRLDRIEDAWVP